jgi:hypothetical protein
VRFVTRLAPNRALFKEAAKEHLPSLMSSANAVRYGNRLLYVKKVAIERYGNAGFAYIGVDVDRRNQQMKRTAFAAIDDKLPPEDADKQMMNLGAFMLIPSENVETAEILPLRVQNEDTFRGHPMLTFLATVLLQRLQRDILAKRKKSDKTNPEGDFMVLRN